MFILYKKLREAVRCGIAYLLVLINTVGEVELAFKRQC